LLSHNRPTHFTERHQTDGLTQHRTISATLKPIRNIEGRLKYEIMISPCGAVLDYKTKFHAANVERSVV